MAWKGRIPPAATDRAPQDPPVGRRVGQPGRPHRRRVGPDGPWPPHPPSLEELLDPDGPISPGTPWIETRAGGLFFVNALLVAPAAMVLIPLVLGAVLRATGAVEGPSRMFDTIPRVAWYFLPRVGWLSAFAAWFAWKAFGEVRRTGARAWLGIFLAVHLATLGGTLWRWFGP